MAGLNIWLLQTWEPNPLDDPTGRPWRTGMLARRLAAAGHQVTWWASEFSHNTKSFRKPGSTDLDYHLKLIPALGYQRHVSWRRLRDHQHVAREWRRLANSVLKPDVIVASYPTIELCEAAAAFAKANNIPLLVDIRDQYPDLYWENAPGALQRSVKWLCRGFQRQASRALAAAAGITANGPDVVDWGLAYARRPRGPYDRALFMSYESPEVSAEDAHAAATYWRDRGLEEGHGEFVVAYTGMIGQTIELGPVFEAARRLVDTPQVRFVFCGGGDALNAARAEARGLPNVHFTGWLKTPEVQRILSLSQVGLVPYRDRKNFETGVTNKPVEYLANGCPVLTSLQRGPLVEMLREEASGATYSNQDPASLVKVIREWVANPAAHEAARLAALGTFRRHFHPDQVYGEWIDLIESVAVLGNADRST